MTEEARAAKREYQREWHRTHPDKAAEYQNRYWEKKANADKAAEQAQATPCELAVADR